METSDMTDVSDYFERVTGDRAQRQALGVSS
jgi:hypothetical protein